MSDATIKNMIYLLAAILTLYPVIELFFKKHKWYFKMSIVIFLCFFWYITYRYKHIVDKENTTTIEKANKGDSLNKEAQMIIKKLESRADSTNFYLRALKDSMKSANVPEDKRKIFKNYIDKVETLNQY